MSSSLPFPDKIQLRRALRARRAALSPAQHRTAALAVAKHAVGLLRPARKIAGYVATGSELSVWPLLLRALHRGCQVYLPRVPRRGRSMDFVRFDHASEWRLGAYDIPEATHVEVLAPSRLDVVFVPLLGFDARLARLGQGGGYYDSTFHFRRHRLNWRKPLLVGVAFDEQQLDALPVEPWDLRLDLVITPTRILRSPR